MKRKHCSHRFIVFFLFLSFFNGVNIYSQGIVNPEIYLRSSIYNFPDNSGARFKLRDIIFSPLYELLKGGERYIYQHESGTSVKFDIRRSKDAVYLLFLNETNRGFNILGKGNYIIKRSLKDGTFIQVKIFIRDDPDSFIRLYPFHDRSYFDLTLYGFPIAMKVVLPVKFNAVLTAPFSEIVSLSQKLVDWNFVLYKESGKNSRPIERVVKSIESKIPYLHDADDGVMNSDGKFVFINDSSDQDSPGGFNCSGFAKWVIDGFYYPLTGHLLSIATAKKKDTGVRGNRWSARYESVRDPYFGLDWSRNLAVSLEEARNNIKIADPESMDVRNSKYIRYIEDVGYPVKDLRFLMFRLSVLYPGYFFIGSLNKEFGKDPVLRQHFHVVLLFPYFDTSGYFRIAVMERNKETSTSSLLKRYGEDYIHLVKVNAVGTFKPISIE